MATQLRDTPTQPKSAQPRHPYTDLVDFSFYKTNPKTGQIAKKRLGGGGGGGSRSSSSGGSGGSDVIVLTEDNFDDLVYAEDDSIWFVEFYAPWCGHCKNLEPVWEELASDLKGKVKVAKVDATAQESLGQRFGVRGYPSIKFFNVGPKSDASATAYEGGRDLESFKTHALNAFQSTVSAKQITKKKQFNVCEDKLCVIAFLPHILDSSAAERNQVLDMYNEALRTSGVSAEFFWSQGGDQFDFEESLHLSFGWPALVAVSKKKEVFGVHRGAFNKEGVRGFLVGLGGRNARLEALPKELRLVGADAWDGKDGELPVEEEL